MSVNPPSPQQRQYYKDPAIRGIDTTGGIPSSGFVRSDPPFFGSMPPIGADALEDRRCTRPLPVELNESNLLCGVKLAADNGSYHDFASARP